jgi:hypothetical protein
MSIGAMDFTPLLCIVGASEGSPFLLVAVSSAVLLISSFHGIDLQIISSS